MRTSSDQRPNAVPAVPTPRSSLDRARCFVVPGILATLAGGLFFWRLGASSYFIDETMSVNEARGNLAHTLSAVRLHETSPPTYAVFLHIWLKIFGSHSEFVTRLPSALAAIGLVLAVWYLANLLADAPTAFFAALLTILSPIVLEYAQQARVYAILMLAATVTAVATVKAVQQSSGKWLALSAGAAVTTVSLHYIGWFVVAPLGVWAASRTSIGIRPRIAYCAVLALVGIAWLPEFISQFTLYGNGGLGAWGSFTQEHALAVLGAPLYGRSTMPYAGPVGACLLFVPLALLVLPRARAGLRARWMILGLAVTPIAVLLALGLAGRDIVYPRYATIAVPFLVLGVAAATRVLRPALSTLAAGAVLLPLMMGMLLSTSQSNWNPDARRVMRTVASQWKPTDFVYPDELSIGAYMPLAYYAASDLPRPTPGLSSDVYTPALIAGGVTRPVMPASLSVAYSRARARRERLWIVSNYVGRPPPVTTLVPTRYRAVKVHDFAANVSLRLVLAVPSERP